ncbi:MAG: hypothetical protein Q9204_002070 [Flavoplaca sp. TL-2023a]
MDDPSNARTLELLEDINQVGKSFSQKELGAREKLLSLSYALASALELPTRFASTKIGVDLNLYEHLKNRNDNGATSKELAEASTANPTLVSRTMKHLAAMNVVKEIGPDRYTSTPFSDALTEPKYRDGITYTYDVAGPSFHHLPAYLKSISYGHPTDITNGPFQYAHKTKSPFFVWLQGKPELAACFNNYMSGYRAGKASWVDPGFYPLEERLCQGMKDDANVVLLVDVGGGLGHDLDLLKVRHAHVVGRLILQDTTEVISQITAPDTAFEKMAYDFFTPQPVHGARAYHLHSVLHDWDDASCLAILKNLASAMEKGYSKVLINELVVPNQCASWSVTSMDWLMLALGAVKERTENDWHRLIEQAGLKVTAIWTKEHGSESLIECELA